MTTIRTTTIRTITHALALAFGAAIAAEQLTAPAAAAEQPGVPAAAAKATAAPGQEGAAPAAGSSAAAHLVFDKDELHNLVHGFRFPVPAGWELSADATTEAMDFSVAGCDDCLLRVMVSPGNTLPLADTVKAIQAQIASNPAARLVGQEPIRIAKESAYTLVKDEPSTLPAADLARKQAADGKKAPADGTTAPAGHLVRTRYVTFGHGDDKYYLVLKAPSERFAAEDAALEKLLARFRFGGVKAARSER